MIDYLIYYLPSAYFVGFVFAMDIKVLVATQSSTEGMLQKLTNLTCFLADKLESLLGKNLAFVVANFLMLCALLAVLIVHLLVLVKLIILVIP